jgi:Methyltransferase domain
MNELVNPQNDRSYQKFKVSKSVQTHPAMLGLQERQLPAFLASLASKHQGSFVELGCYLGGSTVCLLDGLRQAKCLQGTQPWIDSYDLFIANDYMVEHSLGQFGITSGQSFDSVFVGLLGNDAQWVKVHKGDIREESWSAAPISLLYVDILWSWDVNQHVIKNFYQYLSPGSWLIHQDYIYSFYPWLPISMEFLVQEKFFSYQHFAEHSTVSFRCEKPLDAAVLAMNFQQQLSYDQKLLLLHEASDRFVGYPQALLELSAAMLMVEYKLLDQADRQIENMRRKHAHSFADYPFLEYHAQMVESGVLESRASERY